MELPLRVPKARGLVVSSKTVNKITHSRYLTEEELATLTPAEDVSEEEEENGEELETEEIAVEETVDKIAPVRLRIKRSPLPDLPVLIGSGEAVELASAAEKAAAVTAVPEVPAETVEPAPAVVETVEEIANPAPVAESESEVEEEVAPVAEPEPEEESEVEEEPAPAAEPEPEEESVVEEEPAPAAESEAQENVSAEKSRRGKNRKHDYDDDDFGIIQPEFGF